jgi:hypothetical protein
MLLAEGTWYLGIDRKVDSSALEDVALRPRWMPTTVSLAGPAAPQWVHAVNLPDAKGFDQWASRQHPQKGASRRHWPTERGGGIVTLNRRLVGSPVPVRLLPAAAQED